MTQEELVVQVLQEVTGKVRDYWQWKINDLKEACPEQAEEWNRELRADEARELRRELRQHDSPILAWLMQEITPMPVTTEETRTRAMHP